MFVSSYSTYLHTNTTDKTAKNKVANGSLAYESFNAKGVKNTLNITKPLTNTPINYISETKTLNTKAQIQQQLEQNTKNNPVAKYTAMSSIAKASSAYASNSTMFSLIMKNQPTLKQNPQNLDQNLPQEIKDIKESFLRNKMLNTYIANNNYYKITA